MNSKNEMKLTKEESRKRIIRKLSRLTPSIIEEKKEDDKEKEIQ